MRSNELYDGSSSGLRPLSMAGNRISVSEFQANRVSAGHDPTPGRALGQRPIKGIDPWKGKPEQKLRPLFTDL